MLHTADLLEIQKTKMSIAIYLSSNDETVFDNIIFRKIEDNNENDAENQLTYLYQYISLCESNDYYNKYRKVLIKFFDDTNFITVVFNDEVTKQDLLYLDEITQINSDYHDTNAVTNFLTNHQNIFLPFKTITFSEHNIAIILSYVSKLLTALQRLTYQQLIEYKDILNTIYTDAEFFINKKNELNFNYELGLKIS